MEPTGSALSWDTLTQMLEGLRFPARRWEIVTAADLYGAGSIILDELRLLPEGPYRDVSQVIAVAKRHSPATARPAERDHRHVFPTTRRPVLDRRRSWASTQSYRGGDVRGSSTFGP